MLVALYVLSDFGAVAILRFDSFTREIYIAFQSAQRTEAAALGMVLVVVMLALFALYARVRGSRALHRSSPGTQRPPAPVRLGRWRWPALAFCSGVVAVTLVLPVGVLVYWATKDVSSGLRRRRDRRRSRQLAARRRRAAVAARRPPRSSSRVLSVRFPGYATRAIERFGYAGYALPGIVVALALVFFGTRVALPLYQTLAMLVFALSIHYLPLAVGPVGGALMQVPPRLEEAARGLGRTPLQVFRTITRPLVTSGVLAGAALVFLHALKELPATLLLAPIGFETLATDIFRQTTTGFFEAGAIPALILLLIAAPPLYLLNEKGVSSS